MRQRRSHNTKATGYEDFLKSKNVTPLMLDIIHQSRLQCSSTAVTINMFDTAYCHNAHYIGPSALLAASLITDLLVHTLVTPSSRLKMINPISNRIACCILKRTNRGSSYSIKAETRVQRSLYMKRVRISSA
eukprot:4476-Heterococcus_DN1.PRE.2